MRGLTATLEGVLLPLPPSFMSEGRPSIEPPDEQGGQSERSLDQKCGQIPASVEELYRLSGPCAMSALNELMDLTGLVIENLPPPGAHAMQRIKAQSQPLSLLEPCLSP